MLFGVTIIWLKEILTREEKLKIDIFSLVSLTQRGRFNKKSTFSALAENTIRVSFDTFDKIGIKTITSLEQLHYYTCNTSLNISEKECKDGKVAILTSSRSKKNYQIPMDLNGKLFSTGEYVFCV